MHFWIEGLAMPMDKISALDSIALFESLPASVKARIAAASGIQHFGKNALLFREGDGAHYLHGIMAGQVALFASVAGEETVIDFFGPGETLLVSPVLMDLPYMLSARATTDGVALLLPADEFRKLVEKEVGLAAACAKLLARHWRILVAHMKQIKTQDARSRLVHYLLSKAETSCGQSIVTLPGRKKELATHLGIAPETLSRILRDLKNYGVEVDGQTVTLSSLAKLQKLAEARNEPAPLPVVHSH